MLWNGLNKSRRAIASRRTLIQRTWREGEFVNISVGETRSELDPEVADRLFQPFITSQQSGMGVGLSICRVIVEAHRGRIWFESAAGGGTIFHFTLPRD